MGLLSQYTKALVLQFSRYDRDTFCNLLDNVEEILFLIEILYATRISVFF